MGTTPGGLPYPEPTDPIAQGADAIKNLATAIDNRIQTGTLTVSTSGSPITFSPAFATVPVVIANPAAAIGFPRYVAASAVTTTGATLVVWNNSGTPVSGAVSWVAILL